MSATVRLMEVRDEDLPILFEQQRDPIACRMAAFTGKDPADRVAFDAHWKRIRTNLSIQVRTIWSGGRAAGMVGSYAESGRRYVTYWIGREYWGKGIATEALTAFLSLEKARPLFARAARDNVASIRVLEKCGFARCGEGRGFANARGEEIEEVVMQLGMTPMEAMHLDPGALARPSGLRIRPATREDIPAIVRVSRSSIGPNEEVGFGTPRSEQIFVDSGRLSAAWTDPNLVRGESVLVAELDGRVVGCVTLEDRGEALELVNIDVEAEHQRHGIGTRIVRFVEELAWTEGRSALTLGTSRNAAGVPWKSLPWWESLGFRITHEEENAWTRSIGPGVREIRMRKVITGSSRASDVVDD